LVRILKVRLWRKLVRDHRRLLRSLGRLLLRGLRLPSFFLDFIQ